MLEIWVLRDFLGRVPPDPLSQAGQVSGPILQVENQRGSHPQRLTRQSPSETGAIFGLATKGVPPVGQVGLCDAFPFGRGVYPRISVSPRVLAKSGHGALRLGCIGGRCSRIC